MSEKKKSVLKNILCWLLVVLFALVAIGVVVFVIKDYASNKEEGSNKVQGGGFFHDIFEGVGGIVGDIIGDTTEKRIAVTYNGERLKDGDSVELPESGQARFEVENGGKYTVQVLPNVTEETDFNFVVGGVPRSFLSQGDLCERFVSPNNKTEKYFNVSCSYEKFTVEGILLVLYGSNVQVKTDIEYPFKLVVTGSNGSSITVNLRQYNSEKSIEFDIEGDIVF